MKWKKEGLVLEATLAGGRHLSIIDRRALGLGWWWTAYAKDDEDFTEGEGYAPTRAQAKACAEAVAVAMGWVRTAAKPERELVEEWLEEPDDDVVCSECRELPRLAMSERAKLSGRVVHVRRYRVKKGEVGS